MVTVSGAVFENVSVPDAGPAPDVRLKERAGFLFVTAPLNVVDKTVPPGAGVAVGLGVGPTVGAGVGVGLAVGAGVVVGAGVADAPSARSVAYASTRPYATEA